MKKTYIIGMNTKLSDKIMTDNETLLVFSQKDLTCYEECFEHILLYLSCHGMEGGMLQNLIELQSGTTSDKKKNL